MQLLCLSADDLARALPMEEAIDAARRAYASLARGTALAPPRCVLKAPGPRGTTLVMGGSVSGAGLVAKLVTVNPENPARGLPGTVGLVVVADPQTGVPVALCDGTFLTAWRTGAATGAATRALARADARTALVIGTGTQARTQVLGLDAARDFDVIRVLGRREERAAELVTGVRHQVEAALEVASDAAAAVEGADVIAAATTATDPVIHGAHLRPGVHINGVGSFRPDMRELDDDAVAQARVFVDTVEGALDEAGELIHALEAGRTDRAHWIEIGAVFDGREQGRRGDDDITFFKSVGNAAQDVVAAAAAVDRARSEGLGRMIEL